MGQNKMIIYHRAEQSAGKEDAEIPAGASFLHSVSVTNTYAPLRENEPDITIPNVCCPHRPYISYI